MRQRHEKKNKKLTICFSDIFLYFCRTKNLLQKKEHRVKQRPRFLHEKAVALSNKKENHYGSNISRLHRAPHPRPCASPLNGRAYGDEHSALQLCFRSPTHFAFVSDFQNHVLGNISPLQFDKGFHNLDISNSVCWEKTTRFPHNSSIFDVSL